MHVDCKIYFIKKRNRSKILYILWEDNDVALRSLATIATVTTTVASQGKSTVERTIIQYSSAVDQIIRTLCIIQSEQTYIYARNKIV